MLKQSYACSACTCKCSSLPSRHLLVQSQQWNYLDTVWNLFKVSNWDTVTLISLLLTCNIFRTLFWCFYCWLWKSKSRLGTDLFFCALMKYTCVQVYYFKGKYFSMIPIHQLQRQLGVRFFSTLHNPWPRVGILTRKSRLVMNWYNFWSHENCLLMSF